MLIVRISKKYYGFINKLSFFSKHFIYTTSDSFLSSRSTHHTMNANPVINFTDYAEKMKDVLKPPVSNALIFDGLQLKVMFVKGPNQRSDYHLNLGEELFYQYRGDINVHIKDSERNIDEKVHIQEGSMFLLSGALPHSPQRYDDTLGIVIERARNRDDIDGLRWYTETGAVWYEKYFHCTDLGTQIKEAIEEFLRSSQYKSRIPMEEKDMDVSQITSRATFYMKRGLNAIHEPFSLSDTFHSIDGRNTSQQIIASEFDVHLIKGSSSLPSNIHPGCEVFLWQLTGESTITVRDRQGKEHSIILRANSMTMISYDQVLLSISSLSEDSHIIAVQNKAAVIDAM
jgi:3-hydroxyanthranilate 3,4-dioxygenase